MQHGHDRVGCSTRSTRHLLRWGAQPHRLMVRRSRRLESHTSDGNFIHLEQSGGASGGCMLNFFRCAWSRA